MSAEIQAKEREAIAKGEKPPQYYDITLNEDAKGETSDAAIAQRIVAQAQANGSHYKGTIRHL